MKLKQASGLAIIGIILNILPYVLYFLEPLDNRMLVEYSMMIIGNTLIVIFFAVIIIRFYGNYFHRISGILGLIGYMTMVIINMLEMIIKASYMIGMKDPRVQMSTLNIILVYYIKNSFVKLVPALLLFVCFIFFYRGFSKKSFIKKAAFIAVTGQFILLVELITGIFFGGLIYEELYGKIGTEAMNVMENAAVAIEAASYILAGFFFVILSRTLSKDENKLLYANNPV